MDMCLPKFDIHQGKIAKIVLRATQIVEKNRKKSVF